MKAGSVMLLVPALLLAGVSLAGAQRSRPAPQPPPQPPPPTAALPPAPAALSVPNPLAGLRPGPRDLYRSPDGSDRFQHLSPYPVQQPVSGPGIYVPGTYYYPSYYSSPYDMSEPYPLRRPQVVERGRLVLQAVPDTAQVFVDGYYAGLAEEFGLRGRAMDISAGSHRIELRAPGYETLAFSVLMLPNDTVRYRGDMQPLSAKPSVLVVSPPPAPASPKSFYVIPNCYAGDTPPKSPLPKGCDVKNLQTRK